MKEAQTCWVGPTPTCKQHRPPLTPTLEPAQQLSSRFNRFPHCIEDRSGRLCSIKQR